MYEVLFTLDGCTEDQSEHSTLEGALATLEEWTNETTADLRKTRYSEDYGDVSITIRKVEYILQITI